MVRQLFENGETQPAILHSISISTRESITPAVLLAVFLQNN